MVGGVGADSVWGGAGDDALDGGVGDDTIDGGAGFDLVSYAFAATHVEIDLSILEDQLTRGGGVDTLISIEGVIGSDHNDLLTGSNVSNTLRGGGGDDVLRGGGGADFLYGEAGADLYVYDAVSDAPLGAGDWLADFAPATVSTSRPSTPTRFRRATRPSTSTASRAMLATSACITRWAPASAM